ncbi:MAG: xanthine dehydrogenase accessory protein XdhC [Devosia nanyangense]|jgi:xanthine dehydrogenase accessory factor|nr:xanthine dehydrogenase accessory protein XdhC [Devosia nanyangense]
MTLRAPDIASFLSREPVAICAELLVVRGSSPREAGAFMLISPTGILGTIGGGALEHLVIDRARKVMAEGLPPGTLDIPLGPEIGQCCGGRVEVGLFVVDEAKAAELASRAEAEDASRPHVFIFGAGNVGHALALALSPLPVKVRVIDTRPEALDGLPVNVSGVATALPEAQARSAPQGTSYVILTHDHALDFLIAGEALRREDAPYVGMVGSRTKRARFRTWFLAEGGDEASLDRLVLPIGAQGLGDKRPEVIAALAAAEILIHIGNREAVLRARRAKANLGVAFGS